MPYKAQRPPHCVQPLSAHYSWPMMETPRSIREKLEVHPKFLCPMRENRPSNGRSLSITSFIAIVYERDHLLKGKFKFSLKFSLKLPINTSGKSKSAYPKKLSVKKQGCDWQNKEDEKSRCHRTPGSRPAGVQLKRIISMEPPTGRMGLLEGRRPDCAPRRIARRPLANGTRWPNRWSMGRQGKRV